MLVKGAIAARTALKCQPLNIELCVKLIPGRMRWYIFDCVSCYLVICG